MPTGAKVLSPLRRALLNERLFQFGAIFRRPRGMYFSALDRYQFSAMMYNWYDVPIHAGRPSLSVCPQALQRG